MQINTLYQLHSAPPGELGRASLFLTIPDLFNFWLSGVAVCEYSNATTTQMLDCNLRTWSSIVEAAGIPCQILPRIVMPGTVLGPLTAAFRQLGPHLENTQVIAPACHDTGSAVAAVRASGTTAFLSSGTWSLLGTEISKPVNTDTALALNFTNEGGVNGTIRLLKNITGLWLLEGCMRDWSKQGITLDYAQIVEAARGSLPFRRLIDPDHPAFLHPGHMTDAIAEYCHSTAQPVPETPGEFARAILEGLALKYRVVLEQLESLTSAIFTTIRVIGGGSGNDLLNQFAASATGRRVIAGPKEATALGNLIVQFAGTGAIGSIEEGRDLISHSFETRVFTPREDWNAAYADFRTLLCRP
jgi:rhamnulokinase